MKKLLITLCLLNFSVFAWTPLFEPHKLVYIDGKTYKELPIDLGSGKFSGYPAPFVTDWDEDGVWDLFTGIWDGGRALYFKNTGTNKAPTFDTFEFLETENGFVSVTST
jgi:hypothetical protein